MIVYLPAKFEVFSIILTSFRNGGGVGWGGGVILLLLPPPQNEHLKSPSRLGFKNIKSTAKFSPSEIFSNFLHPDINIAASLNKDFRKDI